MPFFGNTYTLRRYGKDQIIDGYPTAGYEDIQVVLDVQTMSDDEVIEAGGSRDEEMLKTFGDFPVRTSKQEECVRSDQLLYDGSIEDVTNSLQSFLKGNFENDAALGLSCTETTRNTAANALYGKSFKDLSEAEKQLTLLQMVEDANKASGAIGQAARESDTWTNQLGNLKQNVQDLKAAAGNAFLKPAVMVLKLLNSLVSKATVGMKKLTSETGILTKAFNGMHALVKRLKPAIDRMMQTLQIGAKKGMGMVKNVIDKLGGVDNALKLLAIIAGAFFIVMNWSKIISGAKAFITLLTKMKGLFSLANLKTLAIVAAVVLLALIVEDFINFLMGNDSVIGTIFDKAGIGADNAREAIFKAWQKVKEFLLNVWDFLKQAAGMWVDTVKGFFERHGESIKATLADFATVEYGKLIFPNGTITVMITNISGFNAVENLIEPTYGRLQETDVELRHSYLAKSAIRSTRMIDSICSQLINNVPNVESATGYENDTDDTDKEGRPPHSVEIIVDGGDETSIASIILDKKAAGIQTFGSITVNVATEYGDSIPVSFNRPEYIYVWMKVTLDADKSYLPTNYANLTIESIVEDASKLQAGDNMLSQTFNDGIYSAVGGVTYVDIKCAATKDSEHIPTSEEYTKVNVSVESRQKIVIADTRIEVVYSGHS